MNTKFHSIHIPPSPIGEGGFMPSTVLWVNLPYSSQRRLPNHIHLRQLVVTEGTEQGKVLQSLLILKIRDFSLPWFQSTNRTYRESFLLRFAVILRIISVQKFLCVLLRKALLKKVFSSNFFPKAFVVKFQPYRVLIIKLRINKRSLW